MTQINPLTGASIQGPASPRGEKERQIRRLQNLGKNTALQGDELEHQVESSDAPHAASNDGDSNQPRRGPRHEQKPQEEGEQDAEGIDLIA